MAYTKLHTTWHNKESGILDSPEDANAWMHVEDGIYNAAAVADNALAVAAAAAAKSANLSDLSDLSAARTNLGTVSATDSRLSDSRTPLAHVHAESDITSLAADLAAKATVGAAAGLAIVFGGV